MARLVYSAITSLDGYVADENDDFSWARPDAEVHAFVNDLERSIGTYLYGRRMYEVMVAWETMPTSDDQDPVERDYTEIWQRAEKVVYSRALRGVASARTRIEPLFDPEAIRAMKASAPQDLSIGGPGLAADAIRAGLVDEWHQLLHPVVVGGGNHWLPAGVRTELELIDEQRFASGVVHLHYRTRS